MKQRQGTQRGRPYKYLIETPDRHGNVRLYYRPPGGRWVRLREKPGTAGFDAEYGRAVRSEAARTPTTRRIARQGSLHWLVEQYYTAAPFQRLDASTRRVRRRILDQICVAVGDYAFAQMEARDVAKLRDVKATAPEAGNSIERRSARCSPGHLCRNTHLPAGTPRRPSPISKATTRMGIARGRSARLSNTRRDTRSAPKRDSPSISSSIPVCGFPIWRCWDRRWSVTASSTSPSRKAKCATPKSTRCRSCRRCGGRSMPIAQPIPKQRDTWSISPPSKAGRIP